MADAEKGGSGAEAAAVKCPDLIGHNRADAGHAGEF